MENKHRAEEDRLYRQFQEQREREVQKVNHGLQEEWEVELEKLTSKFERELTKRKNSEDVKVLTIKHNKEKEEAKKNLTIKREKKKDTVSRKLLEQERAETAALVEKHSKEMMTLIQEKRAQYIDQNEELEGPIGNGHTEEENVQKQLGARGLKVDRKGKVVPELKIHELRAETYNGMIRLLKPGCRTVVLIVDRESKEKLVAKFYKHAWPFRRNKTLMFGFMYIEKGLSWYKKILNLTLPEPRDIKINPKNCIGTVLSLNGHRRYFCMYHAKHPEATRRPGYYTARQVEEK